MADKATFLGLPVDLLTMEQTVDACRELMASGRPTQHVVINAAKVVMAVEDASIRDSITGADLVSADGQSVVWAGRVLGLAVPERVTGIDLMERLLATAEADGTPVYFLGATDEVLAAFLDVVRSRYPAIVVAGFRNGYFTDDAAVAAAVASTGARLLFVAMPSPRKEHFISVNLARMGPLLAVGVGGSFDVWAGKVSRAPEWMRRVGLEWFHRFASEPRRMWRRYLVGNTRFAMLVVREFFSRG